MKVGRTRAALALLSLLVVGAWVGSAFAHGASTKRADGAVPGVSLPSVTATVPLVGVSVASPSVSVGVPAATAPVPAVSVSVPAVSATVPAVTVTAPVVGVGVTTPSATVATPPVSATTPAVTSATPVASAVGVVSTVVVQATKTVVAVATTAPKTTSVAPTATTGTSVKAGVTTTKAGVTTTGARAEIAVPATRASRARRLRLARHRRHAARVRRTTRTTPATSTTPLGSTPSLTSTPTLTATPPPDATPIISGPGDGASLVLTTPVTSAGLPVGLPFLPIAAAANAAPSRLLLSSGPGASSYRLDAVPFSAPLLTGGFNGKSRFVASLLPQLSLASIVKTPTPATAASGSSPGAVGGRSPVAPAGGGRGVGIDTPIGRVAISGAGYQFGHWRYPLASVGGIATTVLISLAALAAISALFGGVSAGAALMRRRRAGATSAPVAQPTSEPGIDEDWDF